MSVPLFKVGELVGLVSISSPHLNGQYHVRAIIYSDSIYQDKFLGKVHWVCNNSTSKEAFYLLDGLNEPGYDDAEHKWCEAALRKIHKVSDYSYDQLLTSLKQTSKIPSIA